MFVTTIINNVVFKNIPLRKQRKNNTPPLYLLLHPVYYVLEILFIPTVWSHCENPRRMCSYYLCLPKALTQKFYSVTYCDIKTLSFLNKQGQIITLKLISVWCEYCRLENIMVCLAFPRMQLFKYTKALKMLILENFKVLNYRFFKYFWTLIKASNSTEHLLKLADQDK